MKPCILIVDDDLVLSQVLSRVLSRLDHQILIASNQMQALQLSRVHEPRLALLDLCLPDGDGVQLADLLRVEHPSMALILMTAYPLRVRDNPQLGSLFTRVLTKPLNVKELRETIESVGTAIPCP